MPRMKCLLSLFLYISRQLNNSVLWTILQKCHNAQHIWLTSCVEVKSELLFLIAWMLECHVNNVIMLTHVSAIIVRSIDIIINSNTSKKFTAFYSTPRFISSSEQIVGSSLHTNKLKLCLTCLDSNPPRQQGFRRVTFRPVLLCELSHLWIN